MRSVLVLAVLTAAVSRDAATTATASQTAPLLSTHGVTLLETTSAALRDLSPSSSAKTLRIALRRAIAVIDAFAPSLNVDVKIVRGLHVARDGLWKHLSHARDAEIATAWIRAYCAAASARCGEDALAYLKKRSAQRRCAAIAHAATAAAARHERPPHARPAKSLRGARCDSPGPAPRRGRHIQRR